MLISASVRHIAVEQVVCVSIHLSVNNDTAVGVEGLSGDGRTISARQKDKAGGNLRRLRGTAQRTGEFALRLLIHSCRDERGPDGSRSDCIHTDTAADVLVVETTSEGDDGTLGRSVV